MGGILPLLNLKGLECDRRMLGGVHLLRKSVGSVVLGGINRELRDCYM
jgi:hypothetical protein